MDGNKEVINKNNIPKFEKNNFIFNKIQTQPIKIENPVKFICKKRSLFKVKNKEKMRKSKNFKEGRWTEEEHEKFLKGIEMFGVNRRKIKAIVKTRNTLQIRTHYNKFYLKMKSCKNEILGIDFTLDSIQSIPDMINQIKSINNNYDFVTIFKYLKDKLNMSKKKKNNYNVQKYNNNIELLLENKKLQKNEYDNNFLINNQNKKRIEMEKTINYNKINNNIINFNINNDITKNPLLNINIDNTINNQIYNNLLNKIIFDKLISDLNSEILNTLSLINNMVSINNFITQVIYQVLILIVRLFQKIHCIH